MKAKLQSRRADVLASGSTQSRGQGIRVADVEHHEVSELWIKGWSGPLGDGGGPTSAR